MLRATEVLVQAADDLTRRAELQLEQFAVHAAQLQKGTVESYLCAAQIGRLNTDLRDLEEYRRALTGNVVALSRR